MADAATGSMESLSSWWKVAAIGTMAAGFAVRILLTVKAYQNAPPIPNKFVDPAGAVVITADDVIAGQQSSEARPDGQWYNLGPWRLSRP
jgi:nitric oxide reductase subunit B